jgi:hypothetical protein
MLAFQNFSPATLLTVIVGLISVLGTILTWDGERMISAVDEQGKLQASDHQVIVDNQNALVRLGNNQQILFTRTNDHEVRISKIEDFDLSLTPKGKRH